MADLTNTTVSVGATATKLGTPGMNRSVLGIFEASGGSAVYLGGPGVTTATGVLLTAGSTLWMTNEPGAPAASFDWYAIVATGTQNINIVEGV